MTLHLLAVSGSIRAGSYNTALAHATAALAPADTTVEVVDLIRALPYYDPDLDVEPLPAAAEDLRRRFAAADGIVLFAPEYNFGLPGGFKNLIDWASRPYGKHCLVGKPVSVVGSSPSSGGAAQAVSYLRTVLPLLGAELVGDEVTIGKVNSLLDPETGAPGAELAAQLAAVVGLLASTAAAKAELA